MGAGPWTFYNSARKYFFEGALTVNDSLTMSLFADTSNAGSVALVGLVEVTNEVTPGTGYVATALSNVTWDVGGYSDEMRFTCDAITWNASGGDIGPVKYAVIAQSSGSKYLVCVATLDEGAIYAADGNPFTVGVNTQGVFEVH